MKKEYSYSMPESFMKDQSVPARWRVLGIINGFSIAGKPCYASNDWFSKELECSIHTISNAFSELEKSKEIYCVRTKRTRVAYRVKPEMETNFHLRWKPTSISDSNQLNTISDSISDSKHSEAQLRIESFNEDGEAREKTERMPKATREAYEVLLRWAESERGSKFVHRTKQYKALKEARTIGLKAADLKERWEEMANDKYWADKGYDWVNVVASFNRKGV